MDDSTDYQMWMATAEAGGISPDVAREEFVAKVASTGTIVMRNTITPKPNVICDGQGVFLSHDEFASLEAENAVLREALKPFSNAWHHIIESGNVDISDPLSTILSVDNGLIDSDLILLKHLAAADTALNQFTRQHHCHAETLSAKVEERMRERCQQVVLSVWLNFSFGKSTPFNDAKALINKCQDAIREIPLEGA